MGTNDYQKGPRHGASRSAPPARGAAAPAAPAGRPLQDNYYYEAPPRGWKEGDAFQDISSYSSPGQAPRRPKGHGGAAPLHQRSGGRRPQKSSSQDIYSNSRPVKKRPPQALGRGQNHRGPGAGAGHRRGGQCGLYAQLPHHDLHPQKRFRLGHPSRGYVRSSNHQHCFVWPGFPGGRQHRPLRRGDDPLCGQAPPRLKAHLHPPGQRGVHRGLRLR